MEELEAVKERSLHKPLYSDIGTGQGLENNKIESMPGLHNLNSHFTSKTDENSSYAHISLLGAKCFIEENEALKQSMEKMKGELEAMSQALDSKDNEVKALKDEVSTLKLSLKHKDENADELVNGNAKLSKDLERANIELSEFKESMCVKNIQLNNCKKYISKLERKIRKGSNYKFKKINWASDLLNYFIAKVKKLLRCPFMMKEMLSPHILPSGVTVEERVIDGLILTNQNDPFDCNKKCKDKITNKFASDISRILQKVLQKVQSLKKRKDRKSRASTTNKQKTKIFK